MGLLLFTKDSLDFHQIALKNCRTYIGTRRSNRHLLGNGIKRTIRTRNFYQHKVSLRTHRRDATVQRRPLVFLVHNALFLHTATIASTIQIRATNKLECLFFGIVLNAN